MRKASDSFEINVYFCTAFENESSRLAQMAESVDALVSNTSGFTSIPVRPRVWVQTFGEFLRRFFYAAKKLHTSKRHTKTNHFVTTLKKAQEIHEHSFSGTNFTLIILKNGKVLSGFQHIQ